MRTAEVLGFFNTQQAIADALGIKQPSVAAWGEYPPAGKQLLLEKLTRGKLKAEPGCYERVIGLDKLPKRTDKSPS